MDNVIVLKNMIELDVFRDLVYIDCSLIFWYTISVIIDFILAPKSDKNKINPSQFEFFVVFQTICSLWCTISHLNLIEITTTQHTRKCSNRKNDSMWYYKQIWDR